MILILFDSGVRFNRPDLLTDKDFANIPLEETDGARNCFREDAKNERTVPENDFEADLTQTYQSIVSRALAGRKRSALSFGYTYSTRKNFHHH
jgi:hypothetical protein